MQIIVNEDGTFEFTRNPNLLKVVEGLGPLSIERMSEINFEAAWQRFSIKIIKGPVRGRLRRYAGREHPVSVHLRTFIYDYAPAMRDLVEWRHNNGVATFATYEDAVKFEVEFVEYLRTQGISMQ